MSNLTDAALDSMQNSEAAATYITESLFSSIFEIDGTADVMISENVKKRLSTYLDRFKLSNCNNSFIRLVDS